VYPYVRPTIALLGRRRAALASPTILPRVFEYVAAIFLSISILVVGFVAFNKIEEDARLRGSIATS
jgi:hypothetical protein